MKPDERQILAATLTTIVQTLQGVVDETVMTGLDPDAEVLAILARDMVDIAETMMNRKGKRLRFLSENFRVSPLTDLTFYSTGRRPRSQR